MLQRWVAYKNPVIITLPASDWDGVHFDAMDILYEEWYMFYAPTREAAEEIATSYPKEHL